MSELKHELGLIALESCKELGEAVDKLIQQKRNTNKSFLIPTNEIRFSKVKLRYQRVLEVKTYIFYVTLVIIVVHIKCLGLLIIRGLMNISKT